MNKTRKGLRVVIVTDAYFPQVSGVATTIKATAESLTKRGYTVRIISPYDFRFRVPLPTYSEIKLAVLPYRKLKRELDAFKPDNIHIAVEGPLGMAARRYCKKRGIPFTTAYHTRFPEYVHERTRIPLAWTYALLRRFHNSSAHTMVAAENLKQELDATGFTNTVLWTRGVDTETFTPDNPVPHPPNTTVFMYMGRLAPEKNIDAFLSLDLPGVKYVVGDGPERKRLERMYPDAVYVGYKFGKELASYLAMADVFVFPSLTDTFGLVMLEANACGTPIAAFPSQASRTVVVEGVTGIVSEDLRDACVRATTLSREACRLHALENSWEKPTDLFESHLVSIGSVAL